MYFIQQNTKLQTIILITFQRLFIEQNMLLVKLNVWIVLIKTKMSDISLVLI